MVIDLINDKKVVVLIQARVSSTRLPKKHFRKIGDKDVLEWILWRLSHIKEIDRVVVSTCKESDSDLYKQYQNSYNYDVFEYKGDVNDVVGRHYKATQKYPADHYIIISGDCPLIDENLINIKIKKLAEDDYHNITTKNRTIHEGIQLYSASAMEHIQKESKTSDQRENFAYKVSHEELNIGYIQTDDKFMKDLCRVSVDNMADLRFMNALYEECLYRGILYDIDNVVDILNERPDFLKYHAHVNQKEVGYQAKKYLFFINGDEDDVGDMIKTAQVLNERYHHGIKFLINSNKVKGMLEAHGYVFDFLYFENVQHRNQILESEKFDILVTCSSLDEKLSLGQKVYSDLLIT